MVCMLLGDSDERVAIRKARGYLEARRGLELFELESQGERVQLIEVSVAQRVAREGECSL